MNSIQDALLAARIKRPYYGRAIAALTPVETKDNITMGVDKFWRLYYSQKWLDTLTTDQAAMVIAAHEVEHLLRDHSGRADRMLADRKLFNIAADMEINDELKPAELPKGAVFPSTCGLKDGLLAEEYYDLLPKSPSAQAWGGGSGEGGEALPCELPGPEECATPGIQRAEDLCKEVAADVRRYHKSHPGEVPAGVVVWADALAVKPKTDWRRELSGYIAKSLRSVSSGRRDYSWSKVSRRSSFSPTLRPGMIQHHPIVAILADTSGSMSAEGGVVLGQVKEICRRHQGAKVFSCDVEAEKVRANTFKGGGGTDLRVGFELALKSKPDVLVVISDCETPWPEKPEVPVVIVRCGEGEVPSWAHTISIKEK